LSIKHSKADGWRIEYASYEKVDPI